MLNRSKDGIIFNTICNFINDHSVGYIFTFDYFKKQSPSILSYCIAASYFDDFEFLGILEILDIDRAEYKIITHIPDKFNYSILRNLIYEKKFKTNWKIWFMTFEDLVKSM